MSLLASSFALGAADHSWRDQALCRDTDPELFFPIGTTGFALLQLEKARQVCGECQVRAECLEFALDTNQDSGIWGGLSEEERRVIRRQRARRARSPAGRLAPTRVRSATPSGRSGPPARFGTRGLI